MATVKEQVLENLRIFSDEPEEVELFFGYQQYSEQVTNLVIDEKTPTPFVIAIHGEWGSGKTTLIKKIKQMVDAKIENKKDWHTIEFDVWEYERVDIVSSLFQIIEKEYSTKKTKIKKFSKSVSLFLTDLALQRTAGTDLEKIKTHFHEFISKISTIKKDLETIVEKGRLIIFLDDLDRCHIDNVLNMLEAIKMFLTARGVIFVIPVDMEKIERAWKLRYNTAEGLIEGREHTEKIFQLKLAFPPKDTETEKYVEALIPSLAKAEQKLIAIGSRNNPRKIKRVINLIYFLLKNLDDDEKFDEKVQPTILWCLLTSYYPEIAKIIKNDPMTLIILSFICINLDFDSLKSYWPKIETIKETGSNIPLRTTNMSRNDVTMSTIDALRIIIKQHNDAFLLFQLFGHENSFLHEAPSDPHPKLLELKQKIMPIFLEVLSKGGMTGI